MPHMLYIGLDQLLVPISSDVFLPLWNFLVLAGDLVIHITMYKRPLTDPLVAVSSQYREAVSAHATSVVVAVFRRETLPLRR